MIPSFNKLQKEKAYLNELHEASLPVLSEKPEIGIAIDFEEYIDCKRHLQFECSLFQELKQYWQGASEEEKVEWLKFDLFRPILRCMNLLRDHHSWEESHDDYTFVVSEDNLKKEQLDSDQLFELLSWYGEDIINGLLKQSITSPVIRRKIRDALKEHKFEAFESALLEAGDSLGGFYEVATIYCSYFPPTPPIDRIEAVDVEKLSPEDLAKMAKFPTNILKPKDEKTQKMVTGLEGLLSELVSNNCIWDHIVSLLAFIRITTLSVEEQQILSVFYDSPLYPTISDDCDSYVKKLKEVLADKYQVSEETKSFHNPGLPDVHVSDENLDGANPKRQGGGQEEYVLHWPTDEELLGYQNNFNADNFYTGTIFGAAGFVKASDIKNLLEVLSSEHILEDDLETQLIFLARYSGKLIPGIVLKPLKWTMLEDREGALGYLILSTVKNSSKRFSKCTNFFYFDNNGSPEKPDREAVGQAAHRWHLHQEPLSPFEKKLNKFLDDYGVEE